MTVGRVDDSGIINVQARQMTCTSVHDHGVYFGPDMGCRRCCCCVVVHASVKSRAHVLYKGASLCGITMSCNWVNLWCVVRDFHWFHSGCGLYGANTGIGPLEVQFGLAAKALRRYGCRGVPNKIFIADADTEHSQQHVDHVAVGEYIHKGLSSTQPQHGLRQQLLVKFCCDRQVVCANTMVDVGDTQTPYSSGRGRIIDYTLVNMTKDTMEGSTFVLKKVDGIAWVKGGVVRSDHWPTGIGWGFGPYNGHRGRFTDWNV